MIWCVISGGVYTESLIKALNEWCLRDFIYNLVMASNCMIIPKGFVANPNPGNL